MSLAEVLKNHDAYIFRIKQCEDSSMILRTHTAFNFSAQQSTKDCLTLKAKELWSFRNYIHTREIQMKTLKMK
jgi:hypothetical protein